MVVGEGGEAWVESIRDDVLHLLNFFKRGVGIFVDIEAFRGEGVFNGERGYMLREVVFKHGSKDVAHELHEAVIQVRRGVVL